MVEVGQNNICSKLLDKECDALLDLPTTSADFMWTDECVDSDLLHSKIGANTVARAPDEQGYSAIYMVKSCNLPTWSAFGIDAKRFAHSVETISQGILQELISFNWFLN